jgi:heme-degrading monooxygenase HmoA
MKLISQTPEPPYYAVIFTSVRTEIDEGYSKMSDEMEKLVEQQPGFLGFDSAREETGITVSYWKDLESIKNWRNHSDHQIARITGKKKWYKYYSVRIAKVEREYYLEKGE